jgi:WD40 repeat protein/transcriptional regulator with XRE-family HTH domain
MQIALEFGQFIKRRRKELDLTQQALAEELGYSADTIKKIEAGTLRPSRQLADLLAKALDVPPEERQSFVRSARMQSVPLPDAFWAAPPLETASTPLTSGAANGAAIAEDLAPAGGSTATPWVEGLSVDRRKPQVDRAETRQPQGTQQEPTNPYKGLRAFQEADAPDFFGREVLTQRLLGRFAEHTDLAHFLAVVGPSGSGKSSVVRAGLIPAVRGEGLPSCARPVVVEITPGAHPFEELEAALLRVAVNPPASLLEQLRSDERGLVRAVLRVLPTDSNAELVLVIDQFEELFSLVPDEATRADFLDCLFTAVSEPRSRLWVVVTLRADFYDRPLLYSNSSELLRQRTEVVGPMTPSELHSAITTPAERAGLALEPDLVSTIMQDVAEQPGALPLLQYALTELYERREGPEGRLLTLEAYWAGGGVFGSLALRAESLYAGLTEPEQEAARQLFLRLVTLGEGVEDTRRRALMSELVSAAANKDNRHAQEGEEALQRVLDVFGRYRMLTFDRDPVTAGPTVEVAHEALLHTWGRLREWLDESREDLRVHRRLIASALEWQASGQEASYLASGSRLAQFEALAAYGGLALTEDEQAYLAASQEAERTHEKVEQERQVRVLALQQRAANRLRYLAGALGLFLTVAALLTVFAFGNLAHSEALRLAAEATTLLQAQGSSERIALLALRSMGMQYTLQGDAALEAAALLEYPHQRYTGHTDQLNGVAFSPNGEYVLSTGFAGVPRLWDAETAQELRQLPRYDGQEGGSARVAFSPDSKLALIATRGGARLWELETGEELYRFTDITDGARAPEFSPDGKIVVIGDGGGIVHVLDFQTRKELRRFQAHEEPIWGIAFSPDGRYAVTSSNDHTAALWDVETGEELQRFTGHAENVYKVAYSPDGKQVLTGSEDGTARLWDVNTGQVLHVLAGHTDWVNGVAFSPDGTLALTGSSDGTARLWDVQTGTEVHRFTGYNGGITSVGYSPDGKYILTGSQDGTLLSWDVEPDAGLPRFRGTFDPVGSALYSPDGKHVLTCCDKGIVVLWDALTGEEVRRFNDLAGNRAIAYSPDGKYVLTGSADKMPRLWDVQTGEVLRVFTGHTDAAIYSVSFSPDGKYIASGGYDGAARVWDIESGKELHSLVHPNQVNDVRFSPDGKHVITSCNDHLVRVWDVQTGEEVRRLSGHTEGVNSVAYSPEGKLVLTGSSDKTVRLWDAETGKELRSFIGHTAAVGALAFSPDARYALSTSSDGTVRVWDIQTGKEVRRLSRSGTLLSAVFSSDGKFILTGSTDGTAQVWHTDYHDTIEYLCGRLLRDFTDAERAQFGISDKELTCPKP